MWAEAVTVRIDPFASANLTLVEIVHSPSVAGHCFLPHNVAGSCSMFLMIDYNKAAYLATKLVISVRESKPTLFQNSLKPCRRSAVGSMSEVCLYNATTPAILCNAPERDDFKIVFHT